VSDALLTLDWRLPPGVHAAFTTRRGGVSAPPCDALNLGDHVGDAPAHVVENRARLRKLLSLPAEPAWLQQVHGVEVADLDAASFTRTADAAISKAAGKVCVIMVADCLPVLFASRDGRSIAAAHAGWRGLAAGVLERTVDALGVAPAELNAWLGPAISQPHFEVGDEVREAFVAGDPGAEAGFRPNARGRWQADLAGLARRRLAALGVSEVAGGQWCTYANREQFFSHRRDGRCGRMAALIWRDDPHVRIGAP
jgi:YfiH family protein